MSAEISHNIEDVIKKAIEAHDRARPSDLGYLRYTHNDENLHAEIGISQSYSAEVIVNWADATTRGLIDVADGRTINIALVAGDRLARLTIDSAEHGGLQGEELRQAVVHALRVS